MMKLIIVVIVMIMAGVLTSAWLMTLQPVPDPITRIGAIVLVEWVVGSITVRLL